MARARRKAQRKPVVRRFPPGTPLFARIRIDWSMDHEHDEVQGPCWLWQGSCDNKGYGQVRWEGRVVRVMRLFKAFDDLMRGIVYPDGATPTFPTLGPADKDAHHLCYQRNCCNPDHVEWISPYENRNLRRWRGQEVLR